MSKTFAIIACFFGLLAVATCQEELPYCQVTYRQHSPVYDCSVIEKTGNGSLEEVCIPFDSEFAEIYLNIEYNSHHEQNFDLSFIKLSGECDCTLTLYKDWTATGCHVRRMIRTNGCETELHTIDFMKRYPHAFRIQCDFVDM